MPLQPGDMSDDYQWLPGSARFPLADLGEHAARLASPVTFDRRGEVIWFDVGDKGLAPFAFDGSGTGYSVKVSTWNVLHGGYNLKLTAGSDTSKYSQIYKVISNISMLRSGLEIAVSMVDNGNNFRIELSHFTGSQNVTAMLLINYIYNTLRYYGSDGNYHTIASISVPYLPYGVYHHMKLVVDFDTGYYIRALFDETQYDLSAYALSMVADTTSPHYRIRARMTGRDAFNDIAYIGHVIITGNEP